MTEPTQSTLTQSLGACLHDGSVTSIVSDLMARTLTVLVDSPYHWEFHRLCAETRFRIIGEDVRVAEVFDFEPWPGAVDPPRETPWEQAQSQRMSDYQRGRLISADWSAFVADINTNEDYEILTAELTKGKPFAILELGIMSYPNSRYHTVRIQAESFRFHVGERELSLQEFIEFGEAYWTNFAQKSKTASPKT